MKNSILYIFNITLIATVFGVSLVVFPQGGGMYDMRGIPAPYNFYHYQKLRTGERLGVGGGGDSGYLPNTSEGEYRNKVANVDLNGIYFVNPTEGWVIGTGGSIYHTEDRGRTWIKQKSNVKSELLAISCVGDSRCWITGEDGVILTTKNGRDWTRIGSGVKTSLTAVDFLNEKVGLVVGSDALILRTENGGISWQKQSIVGGEQSCNGHMFSGGSSDLYGVTILDVETAWIAGFFGIARYVGNTGVWEGICINEVGPLIGIVSHDGKTIFAIGSGGQNVVSTDSGRTWKLSHAAPSKYLQSGSGYCERREAERWRPGTRRTLRASMSISITGTQAA